MTYWNGGCAILYPRGPRWILFRAHRHAGETTLHAHPRAHCHSLLTVLFSELFNPVLLLACIPLIFSTTYNFDSGESGLVLIGIAVGCVLGGILLILLDSYTVKRHILKYKSATPPPERVLWGAMVGGPLMAAALFWFAWTARPGVHWMSSIVATGLFGFSNILVFVSDFSSPHEGSNIFSSLGLDDALLDQCLWCRIWSVRASS